MTVRKQRIDEDMKIGEVLDRYPQAQKVFRKHFGEYCFSCPGSRKETISIGALMHNKDVSRILEDLNAAI